MHTNLKHIYLLNGPPRSGKDSLADLIMAHEFAEVPTRVEKFAEPLKIGGSAALAIPLEELESKWKETIIPGLGVTWRQYQISMSEDWYKPQFGMDIFGRLLVERIRRRPAQYYVVSDSGFTYEAQPLVDTFGADAVTVFHLHREGYTFEGDSRDWVDADSLGVRHFDIESVSGNLSKLVQDFMHTVRDHSRY